MTTYTIEVTDHGDVAAVATDGVATITVTTGSSGGGGGGGAVTSVNSETGDVILSAADVGAVPTTRTINGDPLSANITLTAADVGADATGTAAAAVAAEVTRADAAYDAAGAAAAAQAASQPLDSDLTAIAALSTTSFGRALLALADAAAARSAIGAGTSSFDGAYSSLTGKPTLGTAAAAATGDFDAAGAAAAAQAASQPLDSDLTAIAALSTTSFGRSLLTQADAAAARTTLGAGTSSFDGAYSSLTGKPTLGSAAAVNTGTSSGDVPLLSTGGVLPIARLATGTPTGSKFVRDDGTLAAPAGGGTVTSVTAGDATITVAGTANDPTIAVNAIAESKVTNLVSDLAAKAPLASPTFTGTVTIPTATAADSSTKAASTAFVQGELTAKAPLASPTFTGTPAAPTVAGTSDSTTKIATTAFVQAVAALFQPLDSDLTTLAGLTATTDNFIQSKSSAWASRTPTQVAADLALPIAAQAHTVNAQTGTTYTLVLTDAGKFVTMSNASASTLTVPPNSSVAFPVGTMLDGAQLGAGQVTLTAGAGVTINATPGLKIAAQYGTFGLLKTATDTWLAYGRLSA